MPPSPAAIPGARSRARLLHCARPLSTGGGWLILAPHPDDETLGTGGLIAALAAKGTEVAVAFLTDGSGSHAGAPGWTARRIADLRAREAGAALRILGLKEPAVQLGWRDAAPFAEGSPAFEATVRRLTTLCRRRHIRHIAATWEAEPHCDHEAAAQVATALARRLYVRPLFYCVWAWTLPDLDRRLTGWRAATLPVGPWRGRQRRALSCHRTQLGGRIAGAPGRFVLPRSMRRLVDASHVVLLDRHRRL